MVTIEKDVALPWDAFLPREARRQRLEGEAAERWIAQMKRHIQRFRETDWPSIRLQLRKETQWVIPDGLEPHWTGTGQAVLWQEQVVRVREKGADGVMRPVEQHLGWAPTAALQINNASVLGHLLDMGLRLRPPEDATSPDVLKGIPLPAPVAAESPQGRFWCRRHTDKGPMQFPTWRGYIDHCAIHRELPQEAPPQEIIEHRKQFKFYCLWHEKGWNHKRLASRHRNAELRKPGRAEHPSLDDMEVK